MSKLAVIETESIGQNVTIHEFAVIRRGATKVAVYRDPQGVVHERSAICPHLYCVVDWNAGEKSWDCPCHGSRFDAMGKVLNGPAIVDLPPVGDEGGTRDEPPVTKKRAAK